MGVALAIVNLSRGHRIVFWTNVFTVSIIIGSVLLCVVLMEILSSHGSTCPGHATGMSLISVVWRIVRYGWMVGVVHTYRIPSTDLNTYQIRHSELTIIVNLLRHSIAAFVLGVVHMRSIINWIVMGSKMARGSSGRKRRYRIGGHVLDGYGC